MRHARAHRTAGERSAEALSDKAARNSTSAREYVSVPLLLEALVAWHHRPRVRGAQAPDVLAT